MKQIPTSNSQLAISNAVRGFIDVTPTRPACYIPALVSRLTVFDLDGTLIDSRRDLADATNALLEEFGAPPLPIEAVAAMVGEGAAVLVRRALAASGLDPAAPGALQRFLAHYDLRLVAHTRPYDGMLDALRSLKQSTVLAVLTNKPGRATTTILDALGLAPFFDHVVGGDTPHGRKPDPAGLLHLMRAAGVDAGATVLVGDSPIDRETAWRAGTGICLARYGFGFTFAAGDLRGDELVVDRPADLPGVLAVSARTIRGGPTRTT
jgi:phosphoglycolate phosphatase